MHCLRLRLSPFLTCLDSLYRQILYILSKQLRIGIKHRHILRQAFNCWFSIMWVLIYTSKFLYFVFNFIGYLQYSLGQNGRVTVQSNQIKYYRRCQCSQFTVCSEFIQSLHLTHSLITSCVHKFYCFDCVVKCLFPNLSSICSSMNCTADPNCFFLALWPLLV